MVEAKQGNDAAAMRYILFYFGRKSLRGVHKHNCSHGIQAKQKKLLEECFAARISAFQIVYQQNIGYKTHFSFMQI